MMRSRNPDVTNTPEDRNRLRALLTIRAVDGEAVGMTTFALLYPAPQLGRIANPLTIVQALTAEGEQNISADIVLAEATRLIAEQIDPIIRRRTSRTSGPTDQRWYWVAPLLLDAAMPSTRSAMREWLQSPNPIMLAPAAVDGDGTQVASLGWQSVFREALTTITHTTPGGAPLGPAPDDLATWLAYLALGGPAICAYRALGTIMSPGRGTTPHEQVKIQAAFSIGKGFRSLYNTPEVQALLRGESGEAEDEHYWQRCLIEAVAGNLQAVLDEYVALLPDALGVAHADGSIILKQVGDAVSMVLGMRAATRGLDELRVEADRVAVIDRRMRTRFAVPFGSRNESSSEGQSVRPATVRAAFNSPFWPFVLASTSVGQEGLDFHQYCHAIVHWNLPTNPVDFEQREGRVNRYKGHAIRKNVAQHHHAAVLHGDTRRPWETLFDQAVATCAEAGQTNGMEPYWIYGGAAKIERSIPMLPMSREHDRLQQLKKALAAYRMVFGQPHQDDLVTWLGSCYTEDELTTLTDQLRIDLAPRGR